MAIEQDAVLTYSNGENATDIAKLDVDRYQVEVQTNDRMKVGAQHLVIRSCDNLDRMSEYNLTLNVRSNSAPDFETEVETSFTLSVGDRYAYELPQIYDEEQNDSAEVVIAVMEGEEFPPFLFYENSTRTIVL